MEHHRPEDCFRQGMNLLSRGRLREAVPYFSAARLATAERGGVADVRARSLSYYGLCLGFTQHGTHEALHCCRQAIELEEARPELWVNLAQVALRARRRAEAYRVLSRGLERHPGHRGMLREFRRLGLRRRPMVSALPRSHPLNIWLGRMLGAFGRGRRVAAGA